MSAAFDPRSVLRVIDEKPPQAARVELALLDDGQYEQVVERALADPTDRRREVLRHPNLQQRTMTALGEVAGRLTEQIDGHDDAASETVRQARKYRARVLRERDAIAGWAWQERSVVDHRRQIRDLEAKVDRRGEEAAALREEIRVLRAENRGLRAENRALQERAGRLEAELSKKRTGRGTRRGSRGRRGRPGSGEGMP